MVPSSSFVQHHESLDVFLQPFFKQEAEHHVQESSGKRDRRRACRGEAEVGMLGFKKASECTIISSLDSDASKTQVNPQLDSNFVSSSTGTLVRDRVWNPATSSQEWQKDDPCPKEHKDTCAEWCVWAFREYRDRCEVHIMQISINRYLENVFENLRQKLNLSENADVLNEDQYIGLVIIHVNNDECISSSWAELQWTFGCVQEHQRQGAQDVVRHYAKVDLGTCVRDSECIHDSVDEMCSVTWQSNQMGESKGNRHRTKWARVEYFPGPAALRIIQKIQDDLNVRHINPKQFEGIILLMSKFNDIAWTKKGNSSDCCPNSEKVQDYAKRFPRGHWSFLGAGQEHKWYGTHTFKLEGK